MRKRIALFCLLMMISGMVTLLMGCPPPIVRVRPPPHRVEVYGTPPYPEAVWIPGYWQHRRGEWVWIPGRWERPETQCCLGFWTLGGETRGVGLDERTLGISLNKVRS